MNLYTNEITAKINNHFTNLNTRKSFTSRINKIAKLINATNISDFIKNDGNDVITAINTLSKVSQSIYLANILSLIEFADLKCEKLSDHIKLLYSKRNEIDDQRHKQDLNEDLDINKVYQYFYDQLYKPIERVNKKGIQLTPKIPVWSNMRSQRCTIFSILKCCPIRLTELTNCKYVDDKINNYVNLEKKQLVVKICKNNAKGAKTRFIKLDDNTIDIITKHRAKINSEYLISTTIDNINRSMNTAEIEQLHRLAIKAYCKGNSIEYTKGKFGIHNWRGQRATETCKELTDLGIDYEKLKAIDKKCRELDHSLLTSLRFYNKKQKK
jgi:hypothetical protein